MKTIPHPPRDAEINTATGMALAVLGLAMLVLCYFADGHLRAFPAMLGAVFLTIGALILVVRRHRRKDPR